MNINFHVTKVATKKDAIDFLFVNVQLNKKYPEYIRPLDNEIHDIFDPKINKAFRFGSAVRWLLRNNQGVLVGRIAAFVNRKYKNKGDEFTVGGIGFFDCIDDQGAANQLFDVAKNWLMSQKVEAMDGPINFGERDSWWGLLIDGFQSPSYHMNYNPPYYQRLFENYGFQVFYNQFCFGMPVKQALNPKLLERHDKLANDNALSARSISKKNIRKYAHDFSAVYNAAWKGHGGLKEITPKQAVDIFKKMKPILDEKLIWFAYHKDRPIAMFVNMPDLNQWFKFLDGKFGLFQKLKFLWIKKFKPCNRFVGIVFGVIPEFQAKGVDAYLIVETAQVLQASVSYSEYEMQWIGDFNPKMINIAAKLSATTRTRTLATYRYLFDASREFKRHPIGNN